MDMKKCLCCGSENIKIAYQDLCDRNHFKEGKFSILRCSNCGLEFNDPILREEQMSKYYPEDYYSFYDYNKLAITYHRISAYYHSKKNFLFNLLFYPISPLFYTYYIQPGKSVLEVGCGNGMKLHIYQEYGMKTAGLEPYIPKLTERERKIGILKITIKNAPYKKNSFDYIILKEVLEHIPDQKLVLKSCYKWLKPGGKLIITIPNTDGLWKKIFKKNWYGYDIPRHVYYYNPENISFFLKKFGYKIDRIRVYDMPYMFDGSLKFYLVDKMGGKKHPIIFLNFMKILAVPLSLMTAIFKNGSIIEIHCSK